MIEGTRECDFYPAHILIPKAYPKQVDAEIQQIVAIRLFECSESEFLNPLAVVKKKIGIIRLYLDMINLNISTKKAMIPLQMLIVCL